MNRKSSPETSRYFLMSGLLHAFYWMDEGLQNHLRAAGLPAVSRTQSMIMANIADGITRPADLARQLGISRQAVQQLLADMQARKLISMVPDPADARAKIVRYNEHGITIGEVTIRALEHLDAEIERRLGRRALLQLRRILLDADWGEPVVARSSDVELQRRRKGPPLKVLVAGPGKTKNPTKSLSAGKAASKAATKKSRPKPTSKSAKKIISKGRIRTAKD